MFIYPENLKAKPMLWLWLLRDIAVIGIGALLSVLALTQGLGMGLLVVTVLYAFLTITEPELMMTITFLPLAWKASDTRKIISCSI